MQKKENENKKISGWPEIAEMHRHKNYVVMALLGVTILLTILFYFYVAPKKAALKITEETYSPQVIQMTEPNKKEDEKIDASKEVKQPPPEISQEVLQQQISLMQEKQRQLQQRLAAPLLVVNTAQASTNLDNNLSKNKLSATDPNTQFQEEVSEKNTDVVVATQIGSLKNIIAEGTMIHAVLESATNSDLPGNMRAMVSLPVYSADGSQILIQPGSELIGVYKSGMLQGQSRIFAVYTRVLTPEGISVRFASSGVDNLGVAGMGADEMDRHFWQQFSQASLLSLLGVGAASFGNHGQDQANPFSVYREAVAASFTQSAGQSLQDNRIAPTLKSYQGKAIMVFVARDIDFKNAVKPSQSSFRVF